MNIKSLISIQENLEKHIRETHNLVGKNLIHQKIVGLMVEIGELANENRCFKFWSSKPPSEKKDQLEEYVDGIHLILGIAIELHSTDIQFEPAPITDDDLTIQFRRVFSYANSSIYWDDTQGYVNNLFSSYIQLGKMLGFTWEEIEAAYLHKNKINHERQESGY